MEGGGGGGGADADITGRNYAHDFGAGGGQGEGIGGGTGVGADGGYAADNGEDGAVVDVDEAVGGIGEEAVGAHVTRSIEAVDVACGGACADADGAGGGADAEAGSIRGQEGISDIKQSALSPASGETGRSRSPSTATQKFVEFER